MIAILKNKVFRTLIIGLSLTVLTPTTVSAADDPFEPLNRRIFEFNEGADAILLKPVAVVYNNVVPTPLRRGFGNVYENLSDVNGAINAALQGRPKRAADNTGRVLLNTTIGLFGLFDVASEIGIDRYETDFGHTMARWGIPEGPYVMVPFLGPRTMRSGFGDGIDSFMSAQDALFEDEITWSARAWRSLEFRAQVLEAEELITGDRYVFIRDAYLQSREALVNDGVVVDSFSDFEEDDWDEDF